MQKIYFFLTGLWILSACDYQGLTIINEVHTEENGTLIMEAEHPNEVTGSAAWSTDRENNTTFVEMEAEGSDGDSLHGLLYKVEINTPGTYSIWIKAKGNTANTAYSLIADQNEIEVLQKDARYDDFVWFNRNAQYRFGKGEHTLQLLIKDEDFNPDSIMLLHDLQKAPAGNIELTQVIEDTDEIIDKYIRGRESQQLLEPFGNVYGNYSLGEAYYIQRKLAQRLQEKLGDVVGYKLAFATDEAMENNNLNEPVYGPLFAKQQIKNGDDVALAEFMQFHIENELALILGTDITAPVSSTEELKEKVGSIRLSFDMADGRFDRSGGREGVNDFVASGGGAHRFILGEPIEGTNHDLSDIILKIHHKDDLVYKGNSNNVYGNPWKALLWVINDLIKNERPVKEGMIFLTGKVDSPYVPANDEAPGMYKGTAEGFPEISCEVVE